MIKLMPVRTRNIIALALVTFLGFLSLLSPLVKTVEAGSWYNPTWAEYAGKVFDSSNPQEIFGERYTQAQVNWILNALAATTVGEDIARCQLIAESGDVTAFQSCIDAIRQNREQGSASGPALAVATWSDSLLKFHPASGINYLATTVSKFHLIPEAKAQTGFGFGTLAPVQNIWRVSRNISYLLLIFAFIITAFMIMFRVKISPQAVISVQSALPRLFIAVVLITFSYAIAGLVIDLSFVVLGLISLLVTSSGVNIVGLGSIPLFTQLLSGNPIFAMFLTLLLILIIPAILVSLTGFIPVVGLIGPGIGVVMILIIGIFLLIIALRILWLQLTTLVRIVLLIVAAPLMILLGAVAPTSGGFGQWLRQLTANVAVYPVIIIMLFLAHIFFWGMFVPTGLPPIVSVITGSVILNPYQVTVGNLQTGGVITLPGFGGTAPVMGIFIAIGLLALVPSAGNMIRSLIAGQPFNFGTALGEAFGPVTGITQTGGLGAAGYASSREAAAYEAAQRRAAAGGAPITAREQQQRNVWEIIRAASGGRIRR